MHAIFGLGNPGLKYKMTKHNFGFWIIDEIIKKESLSFNAGLGDYIYCKNNNVLYVKPTTFMNNSGLAVMDILKHFSLSISDVLVIYDDVDLDLGKIRFRMKGSFGGHKGIESIIYHTKTENINRLKIGIGLQGEYMRPSERYVLKPFPVKNNQLIEDTIVVAMDAVNYYLKHDAEKAMNKYN